MDTNLKAANLLVHDQDNKGRFSRVHVTLWSLLNKHALMFFSIFDFFMTVIVHCFICRPSDYTVSEDAEIEPRPVATLTFTAMRSLTSRPDLIFFSCYFAVL